MLAYIGFFVKGSDEGIVRTVIILAVVISITIVNLLGLRETAIITNVFTVTRRVWPSGVERAAACVPMLPLAPGLFSTITG